MFSLTAIPAFGGACAGARFRAAAVRPCLGCASVAGVMLNRLAISRRLPRFARLAIEARPSGRARAGPAEGGNSRERYKTSDAAPPCRIAPATALRAAGH
jgi:hypothetical protein